MRSARSRSRCPPLLAPCRRYCRLYYKSRAFAYGSRRSINASHDAPWCLCAYLRRVRKVVERSENDVQRRIRLFTNKKHVSCRNVVRGGWIQMDSTVYKSRLTHSQTARVVKIIDFDKTPCVWSILIVYNTCNNNIMCISSNTGCGMWFLLL